jgi:hypothetical protein
LIGLAKNQQTQTIAIAIGKPTAKAPTIVDANAASTFTSGRTLSSFQTWLLLHRSGSVEAVTGTKR